MQGASSMLGPEDYVGFLEFLNKRCHGELSEEELVCRYFHPDEDSEQGYFKGIAHRAYLDFNRTLRGIGKHPRKRSLHDAGISALWDSLLNIRKASESINQDTFDKFHRELCLRLCQIYAQGDWKPFHVGQAQKWLNMTLKYVFVLGEKRLPGFDRLFRYCHVPLDNILIAQLEPYGVRWKTPAWSRLNDYDSYLGRQIWVRTHFKLPPLEVEFKLWMKHDVREAFIG